MFFAKELVSPNISQNNKFREFCEFREKGI